VPYSLKPISKRFREEIAEIETIINSQSVRTKSFERDLFIEACFLKTIVVWENFLEEYFLACMCSAKTLSNTTIQPKVSKSLSKNEAFKKLNIHRKDRDKDYLDWLDTTKLEQRVTDNFHHNSRLHKIYLDSNQLNISRTIRNLIAHNSKKSLKDLQKYIINNLGYLPLVDPNATDLLLSNERRTRRKFIYIYLDYYKQLEVSLCS
jgi:hypothetical protein